MSCIISTSDHPEDMWKLRNSDYDWFAELVMARDRGDSELVAALERSKAIGLLPLDTIVRENPRLAHALANVLLAVAQEIATGQLFPSELFWHVDSEDKEKYKSHFRPLVTLLTRFTQMTSSDSHG